MSVVSLILQTGTYQPETSYAALQVINRDACRMKNMSLAVAKATIERDGIVATRDRTAQ